MKARGQAWVRCVAVPAVAASGLAVLAPVAGSPAAAAVQRRAATVVSPAPGCVTPSGAPFTASTRTLVCRPGAHRFVVPAGVTALQLELDGAAGGNGSGEQGDGVGGLGAQVHATLAVTPGQSLQLTVGGAGLPKEHGGSNGGGTGPHPGQPAPVFSGGGGGATDVRVAPYGQAQRLLVAAGGGGGGGDGPMGSGGPGGASAGYGAIGAATGSGHSYASPGEPGTADGNGLGGAGNGRASGQTTPPDGAAGGAGGSGLADRAGDGGSGGGGWTYGGGGAGGIDDAAETGAPPEQFDPSGGAGGGGGSDHAEPAALSPGTAVTTTDGVHPGDGSLTVTWVGPTPPPTTPWQVDTFAGGVPEGPARQVSLSPSGVAAGPAGQLYVSGGTYGSSLSAVDATGRLTTVAGTLTTGFSGDGGPALAARLDEPVGVVVDHPGNVVVADLANMRVRVVARTTGTFYGRAMTAGDIYTVAGSGPPRSPESSGDGGPATSARLDQPEDVALDPAGNLAISEGARVRVVAVRTGAYYGVAMTAGDIYTVAGGGQTTGDGLPATQALLQTSRVATDAAGNLLVPDGARLAVVARRTGRYYGRAMVAGDLYTVAGTGVAGDSGDGGPATAARLSYVGDAAVDPGGDVVVTDAGSGRVRIVAERSGTFYGVAMTAGDIYTVAGTGRCSTSSGDGGPARQAAVCGPGPVAVDAAGDIAVVDGSTVRLLAARTGNFYGQPVAAGGITTVAGSVGPPRDVQGVPALHMPFTDPQSVAVDHHGDVLIADSVDQGVRVVATSTGRFYGRAMTAGRAYTVAGGNDEGSSGDGGPALDAELANPDGVAVDPAGNVVVSDALNFRVQVVAEATGTFFGRAMVAGDIYTVVGTGGDGYGGDGGPGTAASIGYPAGVATDAAGNVLVADTDNGRVRLVAARTGTFYGRPMVAGDIYTVAGDGVGGTYGEGYRATSVHITPTSVTVDAQGNLLVLDDYNVLRVVAAATGTSLGRGVTAGDIYTLAGGGPTTGSWGDGGPARRAALNFAAGLTTDAAGDIVLGDTGNERVRVIAEHTGTIFGLAMTAGDIYTVAGSGADGDGGDGGPALSAQLDNPGSVAVDPAGDIIVVANKRVRVVHPSP